MIDKISHFNFWNNTLPETGYFRQRPVAQLLAYLNTSLVKVLTGQRRCGKSYLLRMVIKHLITELNINPQNILYLNMEMHELHEVDNAVRFMELISEYRKKFSPQGTTYLFLDEIQEVAQWEKVVNALSQDLMSPCEIFLTGSNAHLLSGELATYLTGRYVPIEVFPYSFHEYCDITRQQNGQESFTSYMRYGGMPELVNLPNDETIRNYLLTLRDSIILNDIVRRHKIRDVALLQRLFRFVADTIGSLFSVNSVVRHLTGSGHKTNVETVANQLHYLCDAYLVHEVERYDIQGKRILNGERKYYLNDTAFSYYLTSSFEFAAGKYLENIIYMHFRRQGYAVYVGRNGTNEVDLIAEKGDERIYCQAAYLLADESVLDREYRSLLSINDNHPKYVVSLDPFQLGNRDGIKHIQAWDFVD